jgi:hypothetical protein
MNEKRPQDSFSPGGFQPPNFRHNDWTPPLKVRTAIWIVKDLGVPVTALAVISAVLLGWVDSPLMRLRDIDARQIALESLLVKHVDAGLAFQLAVLESGRKQRCISALAAIVSNPLVIASAALADNPCVVLENLRANAPR